MTEPIPISGKPGVDEREILRDRVALLDRDMLMTANGDMVIVRIFGSDRAGNAVRVGFTPERAIRIALAFIRAALRIKPSLRPVLATMLSKMVEAGDVAS